VVLHEYEQQVEGARAQLGRPALYREQSFRGVKIEAADAYSPWRI
jgi:hypothetical protein